MKIPENNAHKPDQPSTSRHRPERSPEAMRSDAPHHSDAVMCRHFTSVGPQHQSRGAEAQYNIRPECPAGRRAVKSDVI